MAQQIRLLATHGLDNNGNTIINVADPVNAQDAATQNFVINYTSNPANTALPALSGDVYSSARSSVIYLNTTGVTPGTYHSVTVDAKGRVLAGSNPTTLADYGITDSIVNAVAGRSGNVTLSTADISGLGTIASQNANAVQLTGGSINGVIIGASNPTSATFTTVTADTFYGTATKANVIAGGAANEIVYQTGVNTTGFLPPPSSPNTFLQWNGNSFVWQTSPGNQTITMTGDVSGSGTTSISLTLASIANPGTYHQVTIDAKGRVTSGANPTTLAGYGITDALGTGLLGAPNGIALLDSTGLNQANNILGGTSGQLLYQIGPNVTGFVPEPTVSGYFLQWNGSAFQWAQASTSNQAISISGDASGSGTTSISLTLANTGVVAGTYKSISVNTKGLVTGGSNPTTLAGYGITDAVNVSQVGAANGVATLDSTGKLTSSQIPASLIGAVVYQGTWNASSNVPNLTSGTGIKGNYYKVSIAGTVAIDGNSQWNVGDTIIFDGNTWDKIDGLPNEVVSVSGRTGVVTLTAADVGLANVTNVQALPYNQTLQLTGDITSSLTNLSTGSINTTLSTTGVIAGTYNSSAASVTPFTVDAKGRITNIGTAVPISLPWSALTGTPTSLAGYGITNALSLSGGTLTGTLTLSGNPVNNLDAATKAYVDASSTGLIVIQACKVATTANIGTFSGLQTIDGYAVQAGDRILVKNQTTASTNGVYVAASGAWARSGDSITYGTYVFVTGGTANLNSGWIVTTPNPITLGSTSITFTQFSASAAVLAGNGLSYSGNTLSVVPVSSSRLTSTSSGIDLATTGVSANTYNNVTVDTYGRVTSGSNVTYLTSNQAITLTGVISGSGTTSIATTLSATGVSAGTFNSATQIVPITVGIDGRITASAAAVTITPAWTSITSKPTTLSGYGITDANLSNLGDVVISGPSNGQFLEYNSTSGKWQNTTGNYLTTNQTITVSGDATGSGTTSISLSLANVNATAGSFGSGTQSAAITVDTKGRIISATNQTITPIWSNITSTPTTISGYGITDHKVTTLADATLSSLADGQVLMYSSALGKWINGTVSGGSGGGSGTITLSGAVTGSGTGTVVTALSATGVSAGTYFDSTHTVPITVGADGRITGTGLPTTITPAWGSITNTPTTLAGYGITDAKISNLGDVTVSGPLSGQLLQYNSGTGKWANFTPSYLTTNQSINVTGDATGTGSTSISLTLNTVNSNVGSFGTATQVGQFTVDAKGRITAAANVTIAPAWTSITGTPTTLAGYGISNVTLSNISDIAIASPSNNQVLQYNSGTGKWVNSSSSFLTGNQTITLSGVITGSGTTSITTTLSATGVTAGTYFDATHVVPLTIGADGRVTGTGLATTITPAWTSITSTPTTIAGYGITDHKVSNLADVTLTSVANNQILQYNSGTGKWVNTTPGFLSSNQSITLSGDASGTGSTAIAVILATVNSNVGSFGTTTQVPQFTVNAKGLVTAVSNVTITPSFSSITSKPTTLAGYGITDALPLTGGTLSGVLTLSGDPTSALQAATKQYVDNSTAGLIVVNPCKAATTANITLSGTQTIDGYAASIGDRILVKNQTNSTENGVYVVSVSTWSRSLDSISYGTYTFVTGGSINASSGWIITTANPISVGSSSITFTQFSAATTYTAGNGLSLAGTIFNVVPVSNTRLTSTGSGIDLATSGVSIGTYNSVTVDVYGRVTAGSTNSYLTGNQTITLSGAITGSGTTSITTTLSATGVSAGTYFDATHIVPLTIGSDGRVTGTGLPTVITPAWTSITSTPTTIAGYGITDVKLSNLGDVTITTPSNNQVLQYNSASSKWVNSNSSFLTGNQTITLTGVITGSGTTSIATSLAASGVTAGTYNTATQLVPLTIGTDGRITSTGTLTTITPAWTSITGTPTTLAGYGITNANLSNLNDVTISSASNNQVLQYNSASSKWVNVTPSYITGNQTITLSGAITGSGTTSITTSLSATGVTAGTYFDATHTVPLTIGSDGRITGTGLPTVITPAWSSITGTPTTLAGYGITDAKISTLADVALTTVTNNQILQYNSSTGKWVNSSSSFLTGNQTITITGDVSGSGSTTISLLLANVNSNVGSFGTTTQVPQLTVNAKGLVTAVSNVTLTPAWSSITGTPTTLAGYGITNATLANLGDVAINSASNNQVLQYNSVSGKWVNSSSSFLTGNQTITLSGAITGSGTTSIVTALSATGVTAGTYFDATHTVPITIGSDGRVTGTGLPTVITPAWTSITNTPTTIAGYGITDAKLANLGDVSITSASNNQVLQYNSATSKWVNSNSSFLTGNQTITLTGVITGSGTTSIATSLAASGVTAGTYNTATQLVPLTIGTDGRITSTGTLTTITPAWTSITGTPTTLAGYGITNANLSNLNDVTISSASNNQVLQYNSASSKWVNVTPSYITGNQTITLSGAITGSGTTSITTSLSATGVTAGTYFDATHTVPLTIGSDGRITGTGLPTVITPAWSSITGTPTTLAGYGITDAKISTLADVALTTVTNNQILQYNSSTGKWVNSSSSFLTGNQTITITGDVSGSGSTTISLLLANVNSNVGSFGTTTQVPQLTVNAKGLVTAVSNVTLTPAWSSITGTPTTLAGYGITNATLANLGDVAINSASNNQVLQYNSVSGKWVNSSSSFLTGNQTITLSGAITGSGTTSIVTALSATGVTAGTYFDATHTVPITIGSDGRVTGTGLPTVITPAWSSITGTPTTVAGYGITDAVKLTGSTMTGLLILSGDPSNALGAATKQYVDNSILGLSWKPAVSVATTANIALSGLQTIDGIAVTTGQRVLVKSQVTAATNGIYIASSGAWSYAPDFANVAEATGAAVYVEQGNTNGGTGWTVSGVVATWGVSAINFVQFSGAGTYSAGNGLTLSGNVFSAITVSGTRITSASNGLDLATTGVTSGSYNNVTVDVYGRVTAAANTAYLTGNQTITLSGSVIGSGTTAITTTLSATGVTPGTYNSSTTVYPITINAEGRVSGMGLPQTITPAWGSITNKPTTIAGYGITDANLSNLNDVAIAGVGGGQLLQYNATSGKWVNVNPTFLTGNQTITLSGAVIGSGSTSISTALSATGVTAGTYFDATHIVPITIGTDGRITGTGLPTAVIADWNTLNNQPDLTVYVKKSGDTMTGSLILSGDPTLPLGAATKQYVDNAIAGLTWKPAVLVASTANLTLSGLQTVDGVTLVVGSRILVKNQITASTNGIYVAGSGTWARASDFATSAEATGAAVYVEAGTTNAGTGWVVTNVISNLGTTPINFAQFSGSGTYSAGNGLSLTGTQFAVTVASTTRLVSTSGGIDLASGVITSTGTFNSVTVDTYGRVISASCNAYLTSNQTITLTGAVNGSGSTSIPTTLSNTGVNAGTYFDGTHTVPLTVGSDGRITGMGLPTLITPAWSSITGTPTTLAGYGITDAQPKNASLSGLTTLSTAGFVKTNGAGAFSVDSNTYLTCNQNICIFGDATGLGTTSIPLTLANSGVVPGSYSSVTVNAKGLVTSAANVPSSAACNIVGGSANSLVIQTGPSLTGFLAPSTGYLQWTGSSYTWSTPVPSLDSYGSFHVGNGLAASSGTSNIAIGCNAMLCNTTGSSNLALGVNTLLLNSVGVNNIALGLNALCANSTGSNNVAIGSNTLYYNTTGQFNIAVGTNALYTNTGGCANTALGINALNHNTIGVQNIAIGNGALYQNTTGIQNVAVGFCALSCNNIGSYNVGIGSYAAMQLSTGLNNVAVGQCALKSASIANANVAIGALALQANISGNNNTAVGYQSLTNSTSCGNTAQGYQALCSNTAGNNNTGFGASALYSVTTGYNNIAVGYAAGGTITTGHDNTIIGYSGSLPGGLTNTIILGAGTSSLCVNNTGLIVNGNPFKIGLDAYNSLTISGGLVNSTGTNNIAIGAVALCSNTTGTNNIALSQFALQANTIGSNNIAQGNGALGANTSGNNNFAAGIASLAANISGSDNIAIGNSALYKNAVSNNIAFGNSSLFNTSTGANNVAIGYQAAQGNTVGAGNVSIGYQSQYSSTTASCSVAIGYQAAYSSTNTVIGIGANALYNNVGCNNVAVGHCALNQNVTGHSNSAVGHWALANNTSGCYNSAFGEYALACNTNGYFNTAVGAWALSANAAGFLNTALGVNALSSNTAGNFNIAIGANALSNNTTGSGNIVIGVNAGNGVTTGANNVIIGNGGSNAYSEVQITAVANQMVLYTPYNPQFVEVYWNGVRLINGTNFTAVDGAAITLAPGTIIQDGDLFDILTEANVQVSGSSGLSNTILIDAGTSSLMVDGTGLHINGSIFKTNGAGGAGVDQVFWENDTTINTSYTISTNKNAMTAGPITIGVGAVITVPQGSVWTIV